MEELKLYVRAKDFRNDKATGMLQPTGYHDVIFPHSSLSLALTILQSPCGPPNVVNLFVSGMVKSTIEVTHYIASGGKMIASGTRKFIPNF